MSVKALSLVFEKFPYGGTDYLTIIALADWSDDDGRCFPSVASVGRKIRLSERQARRSMSNLIAGGFVKVIGNKYGGVPGETRRYQIVFDSLTGDIGVRPKAETGDIGVRDGGHLGYETGDIGVRQTVSEPSLTVKDIFELPDWLPIVEWNAFVDHRKKLKKPLSIYSMNLAIKELKKIVDAGHKPDDVINEAILRGWQSFYPPKANSNANSEIMDGVS